MQNIKNYCEIADKLCELEAQTDTLRMIFDDFINKYFEHTRENALISVNYKYENIITYFNYFCAWIGDINKEIKSTIIQVNEILEESVPNSQSIANLE